MGMWYLILIIKLMEIHKKIFLDSFHQVWRHNHAWIPSITKIHDIFATDKSHLSMGPGPCRFYDTLFFEVPILPWIRPDVPTRQNIVPLAPSMTSHPVFQRWFFLMLMQVQSSTDKPLKYTTIFRKFLDLIWCHRGVEIGNFSQKLKKNLYNSTISK